MNMLTCDLNRFSEVPLYEQLYSHIKKEIIDGRLLYGTKLPSKRKLAEFLQISQNTVETAYEQLTAEGYVEVIPRKGYYIQTFEDLEYTQTDQVSLEQINDNEGDLLYHFHPSQIDTENFPFEKWRKYTKNKIDESHQDLLYWGILEGNMNYDVKLPIICIMHVGFNVCPNRSSLVQEWKFYCSSLYFFSIKMPFMVLKILDIT